MANEQTRKKSKRSWRAFQIWFFGGLGLLACSAFILWTLQVGESSADDTRQIALVTLGCCAVDPSVPTPAPTVVGPWWLASREASCAAPS